MSNELPKIEIESIVVPATEEKVFDKLWITNFTVNAENPKGTSLTAVLRPYCEATGEVLLTGKSETISLQDLFGILNGTKIEPKLTPETLTLGGQLMGLTLLFFKAVLADKAVPDPEPEPLPEPERPIEPELPVEPELEPLTEETNEEPA